MTDDESTSEESRSRPGRPRSEQSRAAVLRAASELMHEVGLRGDDHRTDRRPQWCEQGDDLQVVAEQVRGRGRGISVGDGRSSRPTPTPVHALEDFRGVCVACFTSTPARADASSRSSSARHSSIRSWQPSYGTTSFVPGGSSSLKIWARGVARGELRADVDPEVAIDLIFGPALYRLVAGHAAFDDATADAIVDAAVVGLRAVTDRTRPAGNTMGRPNAESIRN